MFIGLPMENHEDLKLPSNQIRLPVRSFLTSGDFFTHEVGRPPRTQALIEGSPSGLEYRIDQVYFVPLGDAERLCMVASARDLATC